MIRVVPRIVAPRLEPGTVPRFQYVAGEDIPAHAPLAKSEGNTNEVLLAKATTSDRMPVFAFSLTAASKGDNVEVVTGGVLTDVPRLSDFNLDDTVYMSVETGKVRVSPPETKGARVQRLGRAVGADSIQVLIDETVIQISPS